MEKVYLTITELGLSNFTKEKEIAKNVRRLPDEHSFTITMSIQDGSIYNRRVQEVFNMQIPSFGGVTGMRYAYNVMFREANQKLKGTTFQNVPWEEDAHHRADYDAEGTALVFHKMLQKLMKTIYLMVKK